jgi:hypothetical protein
LSLAFSLSYFQSLFFFFSTSNISTTQLTPKQLISKVVATAAVEESRLSAPEEKTPALTVP